MEQLLVASRPSLWGWDTQSLDATQLNVYFLRVQTKPHGLHQIYTAIGPLVPTPVSV